MAAAVLDRGPSLVRRVLDAFDARRRAGRGCRLALRQAATLWRASEMLGAADLGSAPGGTGVLAGPFRPAPAFVAVWPAFRAVQEAGAALAAIEALGLTVRDAAGSELAGVRVGVGSWAVPWPDDLTAEQRAEAERNAAMAGVVLGGPNYVLTVIPRAAGPASRSHAA